MPPAATDGAAWSESVCLSVTTLSIAKTDAAIEMPFGLWTRIGPRNYVLDVGPGPPWEAAFLRGMMLGFPACR